MRFVKEVSSTLISKAVVTFLGFGTSVIVARALQPQGKGILSTMTATAELVAAVGTVSGGKALTFLTAQSRFPRVEIARTASALALLNGLLAGAMIVAVGPFLRGYVLQDLSWLVILVTAPLAASNVIAAHGEGIARGMRSIFTCNRALVAQSSGILALVLPLWWFAFLTPAATLLVLVSGSVLATLVYVRQLTSFEHLSLRPRLSIPITAALLGYGLGYQAVGLLQMVHYRADLFLVGHFSGAESAGWYSTAANLAQMLWNIPISASFVIVPWVASKNDTEAGEGTASTTRWVLSITLLLSLLLGPLAGLFIRILYGVAYLPATAPLRLLLPGVVANSALVILGGYLMGRGRIRALLLIAGGCAALNIALNLLLLPSYGIQGAAVASTVTYSIAAFLVLRVVSRESGVPLHHFVLIRREDFSRLLSSWRSSR